MCLYSELGMFELYIVFLSSIRGFRKEITFILTYQGSTVFMLMAVRGRTYRMSLHGYPACCRESSSKTHYSR